ncbi:MAG: peroxiredoxin [Bacteroidota bacterium]
MPLSIKEKAPDFTLSSTNGKKFTLSIDAAKKPLIIFFYPKDFTKECTKEACSFRDNFAFFRNVDIEVVGISTDSVKKHQEFKEKNKLPFELLSDVLGKVSKEYKAKLPFLNMSKRITYLLDKEHKIVAIQEGLFDGNIHITKMKKAIEKL